MKRSHPFSGRRIKGVRDEISEGSKLLGDSDIYNVAGIGNLDNAEVYEPFWWRTFRFVRLEIEVGNEPIILQSALAIVRQGIP